jgi:hypothetical protein
MNSIRTLTGLCPALGMAACGGGAPDTAPTGAPAAAGSTGSSSPASNPSSSTLVPPEKLAALLPAVPGFTLTLATPGADDVAVPAGFARVDGHDQARIADIWRIPPMRPLAYLASLVLMLSLCPRPVEAQTIEDIEAMSKWMEVEIVHYKVVGDYKGTMTLLRFADQYFQGIVMADVTDRIEIEFDWNQKTYALVGTPIIRNAPTKIVKIEATNTEGCPGSTKVDVGPEFLIGTSLKDGGAGIAGHVVLDGKRQSATGSFPTKTDGGCGIANATSSSEPVKLEIPAAITPTLLYLPPSQTYRATADKKSIVMVMESRGLEGWTWTITPTAK